MGFDYPVSRRSLVGTVGLAVGGVGLGSTAVSGALGHTLVVESEDGSRVDYSIEVTGSIETMDAPAGDTASGSTGSGSTWWKDGYRYSGEVFRFDYDGPAVVYVDGQRVDPATLGTRTLTVSAVGTGARASYEFTVSGSVQANDNGDNTDGNRAWGQVWGWRDSYQFSGDITGFSLAGDATVYVDGSAVDPSTFGTSTILIDGKEGTTTRYEFTVSESVEAMGSGDNTDGNRAWGVVSGWKDGYEYEGTIESFSIDGPATVYINGQSVDTSTLGDGSGSGGGSGGDDGSGGDSGSGGGSQSYDERVERAIHARVNEIRSNRGLSELQWRSGLAEAADSHSQDMAENDYFSHTAPDGAGPGDRYDDAGVSCRGWGENIAYNYDSDRSAEAAADATVEQWMNSPGHRRNILRESFESEGIGVVVSGQRLYATQNFGTGCS